MTEQETSFKQLLRDFRTREGLSQDKLGGILGVSRFTISRIETGKIIPPRLPSFYDKLPSVPGFSEIEIGSLLRVAATEIWQKYPPKWLAQPAE